MPLSVYRKVGIKRVMLQAVLWLEYALRWTYQAKANFADSALQLHF